MKFKSLFLLALLVIFVASCKKDEPIEYFDHAEQAQKDNDSLVKYMETHFLDVDGEIKVITNNETPLKDIVTTQIVHHKWDYEGDENDVEIDYKLYYYIKELGLYNQPTKVDSAHFSYKGMLLDHTVFDQNNYGIWMTLTSAVKGVAYGMEHFKSGDWSVLPDQTLSFFNGGKGFLLMPSGLAYADAAQDKIPANSKFEDVNTNGDFTDDDTDEDKYPNYYDSDDDGDGILTKNENPDPNGDKNPADALDSNANGIPDYLDKLTK
jgi:hypothetical protein